MQNCDHKKVVLINYANDKYKKTQHFNAWTGKYIAGFDDIIEYGPEDVDSEFSEKNHYILEQKRGNGLWLWKPYFVFKTLMQVKEGDYVFYCDSGSFFCRNCAGIIESMGSDDIWLCSNPLIEKQWTKPELFKKLDADNDNIKNTNQVQASFILIKKTKYSLDFVERWLNYCCDRTLLSPLDDQEIRGECIKHREDQSILSILAKKEKIIFHRDPSQFGRVPMKYFRDGYDFNILESTDNYPVCIIQHRTNDVNFYIAFKQWLNSWLPLAIIDMFSKIKSTDVNE